MSPAGSTPLPGFLRRESINVSSVTGPTCGGKRQGLEPRATTCYSTAAAKDQSRKTASWQRVRALLVRLRHGFEGYRDVAGADEASVR
jgi:hypothetical protein